MIAWMELALDASPRMFLGGVVSVHRDRDLADRLLRQVRACCQGVQAILIRTDGWLERVPQEHDACDTLQSEKDSRPGANLFRGLARGVSRDGDQTYQEETGGGDHTQDHAGTS